MYMSASAACVSWAWNIWDWLQHIGSRHGWGMLWMSTLSIDNMSRHVLHCMFMYLLFMRDRAPLFSIVFKSFRWCLDACFATIVHHGLDVIYIDYLNISMIFKSTSTTPQILVELYIDDFNSMNLLTNPWNNSSNRLLKPSGLLFFRSKKRVGISSWTHWSDSTRPDVDVHREC